MANRRLPMRKTQEILRLHFAAGLTRRQIASSCSVSRSTVSECIHRAEGAGLDWERIRAMSPGELEAKLFCEPPCRSRGRPQPDFAAVHRQLRRKHVTLQLLWAEYKQAHPQGYQYSQFCGLYKKWKRNVDVVMRQEHRAGEKMFVDYCGDKVEVVDAETGEIAEASVFVAVLGASNCTFARATLRRDLESWIDCHVRALEFIGGPRRSSPIM